MQLLMMTTSLRRAELIHRLDATAIRGCVGLFSDD